MGKKRDKGKPSTGKASTGKSSIVTPSGWPAATSGRVANLGRRFDEVMKIDKGHESMLGYRIRAPYSSDPIVKKASWDMP